MLGKAYVFVEPNGGWVDMTQTAELVPSDGFNADTFGSSVSTSGRTVVVGAPDQSRLRVGEAYVFVEPANGWRNMNQTAELSASDGQIGYGFGWSISVSGNTVGVGSPSSSVAGGAVYVFVEPKNG